MDASAKINEIAIFYVQQSLDFGAEIEVKMLLKMRLIVMLIFDHLFSSTFTDETMIFEGCFSYNSYFHNCHLVLLCQHFGSNST